MAGGAFAAAGVAQGELGAGLYTGMLLDGGVFMLVSFALAMLFLLQRGFRCMRDCSEGYCRTAGTVLVMLGVFLVMGAFLNLGGDGRLLGLFFGLCGVLSALLENGLHALGRPAET